MEKNDIKKDKYAKQKIIALSILLVIGSCYVFIERFNVKKNKIEFDFNAVVPTTNTVETVGGIYNEFKDIKEAEDLIKEYQTMIDEGKIDSTRLKEIYKKLNKINSDEKN